MSTRDKVVAMGGGYVGGPLATAIARSGKYETHVYDVSPETVSKINNKILHVGDRWAEEDIKYVDLRATTDERILRGAKYIAICVPTNFEGDKPDMTHIVQATEAVRRNLGRNPKQHIIIESSVYPGVCDSIILPILEKSGLKPGLEFELAHCPERINPGDEKWHVRNIARNIGATTREGAEVVADFYRSFLDEGVGVNVLSNLRTAEFLKEYENTQRTHAIAFENLMALYCDKDGIDFGEVQEAALTKLVGMDKRIIPGCGVGGHCLPKDTINLCYAIEKAGIPAGLLREVLGVNEMMPVHTVNKLSNGLALRGLLVEETDVGVLGLSYKENVSDMRDSPALKIMEELKRRGARVKTYDPHCNGHSNAKLDEILTVCPGVIVATAHTAFKEIEDWGNIKVIVDGRNCLNRKEIEARNIHYFGIGRGK